MVTSAQADGARESRGLSVQAESKGCWTGCWRAIPRVTNENVLVGFDTADDAGVYKLTPELALVQTVDFFTPIVDDPYTFGAIAAANALSDVYAMGGKPISALSMLAYPAKAISTISSRS